MPEPTTVQLRRAGRIEVPNPDDKGRPAYAWVQGWTYTTPRGGELCPLPYHHAREMARQDYPGARIVKED